MSSRPVRFAGISPKVIPHDRPPVCCVKYSSLNSNLARNRARGFLSAIEDPDDSLPPTAVVGERQRISARLVSAPSRSSWVVVCSESTCQRVGVRLLSRAQWRWRVGRLSAMLGPSQTALSWPSTAPLPAVSCGCKKQQMRWSKAGAHCLLQVKTAAINGQLQPFIATHPIAVAA